MQGTAAQVNNARRMEHGSWVRFGGPLCRCDGGWECLFKLFLKVADQLRKPRVGERIEGLSHHPSGLFQSPLQLFAVAIFRHWVYPR